ncbi:MinD/ParA family ATP-binding protein [Mycobacterium riyadhense]|uniref:MinD/ParA family ATP-binding protein n=2 Tax=Mycobacterium riyadhense TaxID=486698 RepID=UPI001EFA037B|nr:MinD/ParA family protein [Mycobacterium riyadhense]
MQYRAWEKSPGDDDGDQATMGDPVSDDNDFDSRYFDDGDDAPQAADNGFHDNNRGFAAYGRVPLPANYRAPSPTGGTRRHGYDTAPPAAAHQQTPSPPLDAAAAPPWERADADYSGASRRHLPSGPPPAQPPPGPAPNSNGPTFPDEPAQRPAQPNSPHPQPGAGFPAEGPPGYPPRQLDAYAFEPPAAERARSHRQPHSRHDASVGDLRAQIRESHVAPPYKPVPKMGWRKTFYRTTRINLGLSAQERHWNDLDRRLKVDLRGNYVIAVMGEKGGVTKTTTAISLGMALKKYRDEKIVAIDANPASGNLARRIQEPSTLSWRGLINDAGLKQYRDFRVYMGKDKETGLEVLASDRGDEMLKGEQLVEAWKRLQVQYPIAIIDCGNQMRDDITKSILNDLPVDAIVVPSTTRLDGALAAADALNWLMEHGYPHLVRQAVVVVSNINASARVQRLHEDFEKAVRAVHDVPFDRHLSDATAIEFWRMRAETQKAYIEAAASLVDGFAAAADREAGTGGWIDRGGQR